MRFIKQSTSVDMTIGPFVDTADGFTAMTALTLTQPDIRLKKNAAAWAQKAAAQTLSHEENGYYEVTLDATDTDTLGHMRLAVNEIGACPVWEDFMVMPANVWDSWFGVDKLEIDVAQLAGTAYASADLSATMKTSINGEVVDALNVDTYAEIGQESPAATQSIRKMLGLMYKAWRNNKTQTGNTFNLFNDDGVTVGQKATVSDVSGTFTSGKITTGP